MKSSVPRRISPWEIISSRVGLTLGSHQFPGGAHSGSAHLDHVAARVVRIGHHVDLEEHVDAVLGLQLSDDCVRVPPMALK